MASSKLFAGNASGLWTNVGNIKGTNNGNVAYTGLAASGNSVVVLVNTYGFSIPDGATIDGIEVVVYCMGGATNTIRDATAALKCGGVTSSDRAVSTYWPSAAIGTIVHGGPTDKWGLTPAVSDINSSTFEFALSAHNDGTSSRYAYVDAISIEVFYTEASQGGTATPSGVSATASLGTSTAAADAGATPSGFGAISALGAAVASGAAGAIASGFQAAASLGAVLALAAALALPPGVQAQASVGQPVVAGAAAASPPGLSASAALGDVSASADNMVVALPAGVGAVAYVGTPPANGSAICSPAGLPAASGLGQVSAVVSVQAHPPGLSAQAGGGVAAATGAAEAAPSGLSAQANVGQVQAGISGQAPVSGVQALGAVGTASTEASASALPGGQTAYSTAGASNPSASANVAITGVNAGTSIGSTSALALHIYYGKCSASLLCRALSCTLHPPAPLKATLVAEGAESSIGHETLSANVRCAALMAA